MQLMWNLEKYESSIAIQQEDGAILTYKELEEEGNQLGNVIGERCLVFSFCTNTIGSIVGYTAFLNHRMVPLLLNSHMDEEMIQTLLEIYGPKCLWMPEEMMEKSMFEGMTCEYRSSKYVLLKNPANIPYELHEDLALLLTTSGSTGSPKFVRQSYRNIRYNAEQIVEYLKLDDKERPISTLPMNYTYGLSIINSHLLVGATLLMTDSTFMDRGFWEFLEKGEATSFGGVPYTFEMLNRLRFCRMNLPHLKYITQAGGKLTPELHKIFAQYAMDNDKKFIVMYGACEATARMGYLPAEKSLEKYGSCGIVIPGGKYYLVDEENHIIEEPYIAGELVYEGDNVTMGYAECGEDLRKEDERHGVLHTGDMAQRDLDGYYYIVGRKKRFLKIFGNRVNLDEIDRMVKNRFDFIDCASAGSDDHMKIYVTQEAVMEEVLQYVSEKTKLHPSAIEVILIDEIPKNDAGKILYNEL